MLISPEYVALNAELHRRVPTYGVGGHRWADKVRELVKETGADSVLDYGCGKGSLGEALKPLKVYGYDPAIPGKQRLPEFAGVVVCTDVMEHVEAKCIGAVIENLCNLATRAVLVVVSCRVGGKRLANGKPAHISVHPAAWWHERFTAARPFVRFDAGADEYAAVWRRE